MSGAWMLESNSAAGQSPPAGGLSSRVLMTVPSAAVLTSSGAARIQPRHCAGWDSCASRSAVKGCVGSRGSARTASRSTPGGGGRRRDPAMAGWVSGVGDGSTGPTASELILTRLAQGTTETLVLRPPRSNRALARSLADIRRLLNRSASNMEAELSSRRATSTPPPLSSTRLTTSTGSDGRARDEIGKALLLARTDRVRVCDPASWVRLQDASATRSCAASH